MVKSETPDRAATFLTPERRAIFTKLDEFVASDRPESAVWRAADRLFTDSDQRNDWEFKDGWLAVRTATRPQYSFDISNMVRKVARYAQAIETQRLN